MRTDRATMCKTWIIAIEREVTKPNQVTTPLLAHILQIIIRRGREVTQHNHCRHQATTQTATSSSSRMLVIDQVRPQIKTKRAWVLQLSPRVYSYLTVVKARNIVITMAPLWVIIRLEMVNFFHHLRIIRIIREAAQIDINQQRFRLMEGSHPNRRTHSQNKHNLLNTMLTERVVTIIANICNILFCTRTKERKTIIINLMERRSSVLDKGLV